MNTKQNGDPRPRQPAEDVHHLRRVRAVQPGGRFVQKHDPRAGEQLGGDGHAPFLTPAQPAGELVTDEARRHLDQAELTHPTDYGSVHLVPRRIQG